MDQKRPRIVFFGTPKIAETILNSLVENLAVEISLVVTQPDRPAGRGKKISHSPVKSLALLRNIPIYQPHSLRREMAASLATLSQFGPFDLGVVVAFGQILPPEILSFPRLGCINIHASLLPRWRGAAPVQRSILAGDTETGVCLMQMDPGLDTGPVFSQLKTPIQADEDSGALLDRLAVLGADIINRDLLLIIDGKLKATPQASAGVTYAEKIRPEESLIDWNVPAKELALRIRAMSPHPGAFTFINGQRFKIFRVRVAPTEHPEPGKVVISNQTQMIVSCAEGALELNEVQLEGKKRMPITEFLRGYGEVLVGTLLGS